MDALKTVVVFPLVSLIQYSRFTVSSIIILPFLLVNYITLGKKSLNNFAIYNQAKRIPFFGKWFFSGLGNCTFLIYILYITNDLIIIIIIILITSSILLIIIIIIIIIISWFLCTIHS